MNGNTPDLAIAARWGYSGLAGAVMPGPGKTTTGTRGEGFLDIHLNATTRWKDVPESAWNYTLGGYQVLKKCLSYRESALLGRPLTSDETQQLTHHLRRIASILALHGELDLWILTFREVSTNHPNRLRVPTPGKTLLKRGT